MVDPDVNCDQEFTFISRIIDVVGPRVPGSAAERRAAELIKADFTTACGVPAIMEDFTCATKASIGFIPVFGYALLFVITPLSFISPLLTGIGIIFFLFFAIVQVFKYLAWFDGLFPKSRSQNVHAIVEPRSSNARTTIVVAAHIDSSWHSPLFAKKPHQARFKIIYGLVGIVIFCLILLARGIMSPALFLPGWDWWNLAAIPFLPGFYFITTYITWNEKIASPGAMDDLAGIALTRWLAMLYRDHPDRMPADTRFVYTAFGCEEAGLKGSHAFVQRHRGDLLAENCYVIILDGISDFDHFHVVRGDTWLGTNYDAGLVKLADEAMTAAGIVHDVFKNPDGSTDGASFSRAGIKVVTLAAQDPGPATNYHTRFDVPERIDRRVVVAMKEILLGLIDRITGKK
jgi:hypothetical protein